MPEWAQDPASDFHFVECADAEDGAAKILQIVRERIPLRYGLDPIRDIALVGRLSSTLASCGAQCASTLCRIRVSCPVSNPKPSYLGPLSGLFERRNWRQASP
jgi:hypothetical protein